MLAHERLDHARRRRGAKPIRARIRAAIGAPATEWSCGAGDLADVVQQGGDQQQVGPVDAADEAGARTTVSIEVPVDGVPVARVALRP